MRNKKSCERWGQHLVMHWTAGNKSCSFHGCWSSSMSCLKPWRLGRAGAVSHRIDTGSSPPICQQVHQIPQFFQEKAKQLLQGMLKKDVVQPSASPRVSPVVLVRKKNGSVRICVDYLKINAVTRKDVYPFPRIDDTLDTLSGSQWFSTLDLVSGY